MAHFFNVPPSFSLVHVSGNRIIFDSFLKAVVAVNNNEVYWPQIIAFYLYAQFLLVFPSGDYDLKIMQILDQVESGLNFMLVILAETLIGLDNLPMTHHFTRSPILLEVHTLFLPLHISQIWF